MTAPAMTLRETVAIAIRDKFPFQYVGRMVKPKWEELGPSDQETWLRQADAAIAAVLADLRTVSNGMKIAGVEYAWDGTPVWLAMLDAWAAERLDKETP